MVAEGNQTGWSYISLSKLSRDGTALYQLNRHQLIETDDTEFELLWICDGG